MDAALVEKPSLLNKPFKAKKLQLTFVKGTVLKVLDAPVLTYHTGRHPLGKIREENGNIQNY